MRVNVTLAVMTGCVVLALIPLGAQQSPFMSDRVYRMLVNEISGDVAYEHIRVFTRYHKPTGSEGFEAVARYFEEKAKEYGLEDVRYIKQPFDGQNWTSKLGELWLTEPDVRRLAFTPEVQLSLADYSRSTDIPSAELVDVGDGEAESDYAGKQVTGKIVLASGPVARVMEEAVWKRGALGLVVFTMSPRRIHDFPDQLQYLRIPIASRDGTKQGTFAFELSNREGMYLRREMAAAKGKTYRVRAKIDAVFSPAPYQAIVEAVIRGSEIHDQDVVLTGHLQEEKFSANDDGSGCANVLEVARAFKKMIDEGTMPRPRRDIRFWWVNENRSEDQYFADHPEEARQMLANINQDMSGAKQSVESRVQFVTFPPYSRASYLGDVVESVISTLVDGNTSYLSAHAAKQMRNPWMDTEELHPSKGIYSRLGTRERYDARVIPFHNSTDSQTFNQGVVGVPATTFTDWPDENIHSTSDDLWQVDPTQLKRNNIAVAAMALYLANAGDTDLPGLAAHMYGKSLQRLSRDARIAMERVVSAAPVDRAAAYAQAEFIVRHSVRREKQSIESIRAFVSKGGAGENVVVATLSQLPTEAGASERLAASYTSFLGGKPPNIAPTARERELAAKVPAMAGAVRDFMAARSKLKMPDGLHGLMAYEVLNYINGTNSYLDIYHAVATEATIAGDWYYGTVTLEDVASYLDSAEQAGMTRVTTAPAKKTATQD
jgi:hypothetical protein